MARKVSSFENTQPTVLVNPGDGFGELICRSAVMQRVIENIQKVAACDHDVLIMGETGTGKELVARAIHQASCRRERPFRAIQGGAVPDTLMEDTLFGHEKGAYTGALTAHAGELALADGGILFLDELNLLPPLQQPKFLRLLQERTYHPVGDTREVKANIRILFASSADLPNAVELGRFLPELYYRVSVLNIVLPPLRERGEDIPLLASHFCQRYARELDRPGATLSPDVLAALSQYSWPGNVRQLQNLMLQMVLNGKGGVIGVEELPREVVAGAGRAEGARGKSYVRENSAFQHDFLRRLLTETRGNALAAAQKAGMSLASLYRALKKHGLRAAQFR